MKVEIVQTLKGSRTWRKGLLFDTDKAPVPGEILRELENGSGSVRRWPDPAPVEKPKVAEAETVNEIELPAWLVEKVSPVLSEKEDEDPDEDSQDKQSENVEKEYVCSICGWTGKTDPALKRHITINHNR